jgi:hypothetical protein
MESISEPVNWLVRILRTGLSILRTEVQWGELLLTRNTIISALGKSPVRLTHWTLRIHEKRAACTNWPANCPYRAVRGTTFLHLFLNCFGNRCSSNFQNSTTKLDAAFISETSATSSTYMRCYSPRMELTSTVNKTEYKIHYVLCHWELLSYKTLSCINESC